MATTLHPLPIHLQLPRPPGATNGIPLSKELRGWLDDSVSRWDRELVRALELRLSQMTSLLNELISGAGVASLDAMRFNVELLGTKDDTNTVFTSPFAVRLDPTGTPQAILWWKTGPQLYTTSDPPEALRWTRRSNGDVVLGQPPHEGDSLIFAFAIAE